MFQFDNFAHFIQMDGHGFYVWLSYGISFAVMTYLLVQPLLRTRQTIRRVKRQNTRQTDFDSYPRRNDS